MTHYEVRSVSLYCPYCGEAIEVLVDLSLTEQEYIEDCQVCCQPIALSISVRADGDLAVDAEAESR